MSLYADLQKTKNESDIEMVYKKYFDKLFKKEKDIQITREQNMDGIIIGDNIFSLLEFKRDLNFKKIEDRVTVLIQCLYYLQDFHKNGKALPTSIFIGDNDECFILDAKVLKKYLNKDIKGSASTAHMNNPELMVELSEDIDIQEYNSFCYFIDDKFKLNDVVDTLIKIHSGDLTKVKINNKNIVAAFDIFDKEILVDTKSSPCKLSINQRVNLFLQLLINSDENGLNSNNPTILFTKNYGNVKVKEFKSFFKKYEGINYTPNEKEELTAYGDRLIEDETRRRKGEFFTPAVWADEAHKEISNHLGEDWKDRYIVWDCACGSANLTRDYNFKELYLSTLEQSDIDTIKDMGYNSNATIFQFDFLNDEGRKLPDRLKSSLKEGKEILFFINPPYARQGNMMKSNGSHKDGVANTKLNKKMIEEGWGKSAQNLYTQFLYRIYKLNINNNITIVVFAKSSYKTSPSFNKFREKFLNKFEFIYSMLFCANHFSDTAESWGIDFSIWKSGKTINNEFNSDIKDIIYTGISSISRKSLYNLDNLKPCSDWVRENLKNKVKKDFPYLSSSMKIKQTGYGTSLDNNMGYMLNTSNNAYENSCGVALFSSCSSKGNGFSIMNENFYKVTTLFTARKSIKGTWINDKDEYIAPNEDHPEWQQFVNDSIVYSLFNNSSQQSSLRQITYKDKLWDIKNEFFWLSTDQIMEAANNANYDSLYKDVKNNKQERFVYNKLKDIELSQDAREVLDAATELLLKSMAVRKLMSQSHPDYHLDSWDSGYAQLKLVWKKYYAEEFKAFRDQYKAFEQRMIPMVYELGFLRK
jgi:hypothetical protein